MEGGTMEEKSVDGRLGVEKTLEIKGLVLVDGADIGAAGTSEQLEAKNLVEQVVGNTTKLPQ
ncbi:unnamed protein product, partial [Sphagnum compactum]